MPKPSPPVTAPAERKHAAPATTCSMYARAPGKPACSFGAKCYRKNPAHFREEDHPDDHPLILADAAKASASASDEATPGHKRPRDYEAPPPATAGSSSLLDDDDDDDFAAFDIEGAVAASKSPAAPAPAPAPPPLPAPPPAPVAGSSAAAAPLAPYTSQGQRAAWAEQLRATFLTPFGDDAFALYEVALREHPSNPTSAFSTAGVTLLAPFDLLSGDLLPDDASALTDRGEYDPPEFQPLVRVLEGKDGTATIGYWRDEPSETPTHMVVSRANQSRFGPGVSLTPLDEPHLLRAVAAVVRKAASSTPLRSQSCTRIADALSRAASALGVPSAADADGFKPGAVAAARKRKAVAPTTNRMGLVVPYDKQSEVGYRELSLSGGALRKLLDKLDGASGAARSTHQAELDELVHWANIANDECDFGASLQLGQDIFNHSLSYAALAGRTLSTSYMLLDRMEFATIAEQHAAARAQQGGGAASS